MNRVPVTSSNIHSVGYNPRSNTLEVAFKNKAGDVSSVYQYDGVPQNKADAMLAAGSVGRYFATEIKGHYTATKVS
jgi:hypothetical protein